MIVQASLRRSRPLALILVIALSIWSVLNGQAEAVMVTTESVLNVPGAVQPERARVRAFLNRAEVRAKIESYGISPEEAIARVDNLTDGEIADIQGALDRLPAGGQGGYAADGYAAVVLIVVAVLIVVGFVMGVKWIVRHLSRSQEQSHEEQSHKQPRQQSQRAISP